MREPQDSNRFCGDDTVTDDDRRWCREELQQLLDRVYPPLVVRELLILQTGIPDKYFTVVSVRLIGFVTHGVCIDKERGIGSINSQFDAYSVLSRDKDKGHGG